MSEKKTTFNKETKTKKTVSLIDKKIKKKSPSDQTKSVPEDKQKNIKTTLDLLKSESSSKPKKRDFTQFIKPKEAIKSSKSMLDLESLVIGKPKEQDSTTSSNIVSTDIKEDVEQDIDDEKKVIHIKPPIMINDLAKEMSLQPYKLIKDLMGMDIFASINHSIEPDIAKRVCQKHGFVFKKETRTRGAGFHKKKSATNTDTTKVKEEGKFEKRPPVITFMGHIDHGKTSLLDYIRKTKITNKEAGGITQHIGAYKITHNNQEITFLDTPGHAAFTKMRARGAGITDIVILVIAADDGLMPQTKEAITHAQAANVSIIVAINKCDLPAADPQKVKMQLQDIGIAPEEWGGETIFCEVSAQTGKGVDELLEMMLLQSEVLELQSNPTGPAKCIVIESKIEKGKGPTASVIVRSGNLSIGDPFICGNCSGKVKLILNDKGESIKKATLSDPIEIIGFESLPNVGEELIVLKTEREAKKISVKRQEEDRKTSLVRNKKATLESLFEDASEEETKTLNLLIKTDVLGSAEAIINSLEKIPQEKVNLVIINSSAGSISESDILLASASNAIILGFNTKLENKALSVVKQEGVQVKLFSIIYELIDTVKEAMLGLLDPKVQETTLGKAEILQVFKVSSGKVAGSRVTSGKITKNSYARVERQRQAIFDGKVTTLKRFQEDAIEVKNGLECGIKLGDFNDYAVGDVIIVYKTEQLKQSL